MSIAEIYSLKSLYDNLNGEAWQWKENIVQYGNVWNFSTNLKSLDPCVDSWQGVNCTCIGGDCVVTSLNLNNYGLKGVLSDMNNLTSLYLLDLGENTEVSGNLLCLNALYSLETLSLYDTGLHGDVQLLGNFTKLKHLYLNQTYLNGSIQSFVGMTQLVSLSLEHTALYGDIHAIKYLTLLKLLDLSDSTVSGDIEHLGQLTLLKSLDLSYNSLIYGDLKSLRNLTTLKKLYLDFTEVISENLEPLVAMADLEDLYLSGTNISCSMKPIASLTNLRNLDLSDTSVEGDLSSLQGLSQLTYIDLGNTLVTGTLEPLTNLVRLTSINLYYTLIDGSLLPLINLTNLTELNLPGTAITGDLGGLSGLVELNTIRLFDTNIGGGLEPLILLEKLKYVYIYNAALIGTLWPFSSKSLIVIELFNNQLYGNLSALSSIVSLEFCILNDNKLTGQLPNMKNTSLVYFNVENNLIEGGIMEDFFPDSLEVVDVANNVLSGAIPNALFAFPRLQVLDASVNCLTLEFTQDICNSRSLQYLILDGIHSAKACRPILPIKIVDTIYKQSQAVAKVPDCIYDLGQLVYLHLSGNGIEGQLPADANLSINFTELVLANNQLQSVIPPSFQSHQWVNIDLSYNRITGELWPNWDVSDSISLKVNRLSGNIPRSLYRTADVSILTGNMFACSPGQLEELHDELGDKYICSSRSFDNIGFIWLFFILVVLIVIVPIYVTRKEGLCNSSSIYIASCFNYVKKVADSITVTMNIGLLVDDVYDKMHITLVHVKDISMFIQNFRYASGVLAVVIVCLYMPLFSLLSTYYCTYYNQYAWTVSLGFLAGVVPAVIVCTVFTATLLAFYCYYAKNIINILVYDSGYRITTTPALVIAYISIFCANLGVVLSLNGCYIYILSRYNTTVVTLTEIALSILKIIWTNYILIRLVRSADIKFIKSSNVQHTAGSRLLTMMAIMNIIVIPCLATSLIDPNCFYNLIYSAAPIEAKFNASKNYITILNDKSYRIHVGTSSLSEYNPSFSYTFQCSSVILTSYATIFMWMALFSVIIPPTIDYLRIQGKKNLKTNYLNRISSFLMGVLQVSSDGFIGNDDYVINQAYMDRITLSLVSNIAVFVTFGVMAPILGLTMFLTINCQAIYVKFRISKYLQSLLAIMSDTSLQNGPSTSEIVEGDCRIKDAVQLLDSNVKRLRNSIIYSTWQILFFMGLFYGLFIFDIAGYDAGVYGACWAPFTMLILFNVVYLSPTALVNYINYSTAIARLGEQSFMTEFVTIISSSSKTKQNNPVLLEAAAQCHQIVNPINSQFETAVR